ncbi:integrase arm-type DNA-binding domain-containing protein [Ochrobactrum vermis]|uniref:Integrase arm-type DNA-binding domain-containing protein n=1 Tax=Ochrobactrum vermis TaxID=1827297 RepID=A0ABU8PHZ6_9HYPH|nr:site-specific integrase [Ochrobactrum vermis]
MARENLTDRRMHALKPAPAGTRYDIQDGIVPGLAVRVTDKGTKTFVLVARFPGSNNPTRRAIGEYGRLTLEQARNTAREWHELVRRGIDPRSAANDTKDAEVLRRGRTFGRIVEDYLRLSVVGADENNPIQRKGLEVARDLKGEFLDDKPVQRDGKTVLRKGLRDKPIDEICKADILIILDDAVARGAKYQAFNLLGHARTFFNWVISRGVYGIEISPCDRMRPNAVIGKKASRKRVLNDAELFAYWRATKRLGYPYGPLFQLLLLTGQRKSEVADAVKSEFDRKAKLWTIPPARMKAENAHSVPLTDSAISVLDAVNPFIQGKHIFSTTEGKKPVNGFSKAKVRLDKEMLRILRALARKQGDEADEVDFDPFVIHDIRRTVRTRMSALPISSTVAELVIAHTQKGLHAVYDQHAYETEKRHALELWAARLREITSPAPDNIINLNTAQG